MVIIPNSDIILLKCPLEIDEINQLTFSNATAQYNYFNSLPKIECSNATYQRKDEVLRFPTDPTLVGTTYDDLLQYNYCMYQNTAWGNKWFYAYIKNVTFDNPGMSLIELETDVFQTWQFDITWKRCFIEREHVNDDTFGLHTVPENLDTGEFIINEANDVTRMDLINTYIGVSRVQNGLPGFGKYGGTYCNVYSGLTYYVFSDSIEAGKFIKGYDRAGHPDDIYAVFVLPQVLYNPTMETLNIRMDGGDDAAILETPSGHLVTDTTLPITIASPTISRNTTLNGYAPKNNKLFTGEFNYLYITNNGGSDVKYNYEDFTGTPSFKIEGCICIGGAIKLFPTNYKLYDTSPVGIWYWSEYPYGISCAKYPTCSWTNDVYTSWLVQNAQNWNIEDTKFFTNQLMSLGTNPTASDGIGLIGNTFNHYLDRMALKKQYSYMPYQAKGNINSGDITLVEGAIGFWYYKMSVRYEYAKRIDDFLSAFGYKVNSFKIPNITGRTNWNYVKTVGCNIMGNIPQQDIVKIKNMFNNGVTLWHNPSTFLDYSQSNTIVS